MVKEYTLSIVTVIFATFQLAASLSVQPTRRDAVSVALGTAIAGSLPIEVTAEEQNGLAAKLAKRDPSLLRNSVFNIPPAAQVYPDFLRGTWDVTSRFNGYIFPSDKISKTDLTNDFEVPGFQKCSIVAISDVGKQEAKYKMKIDKETGLEDRAFNLEQEINAYLGYNAVAEVLYDPRSNANRLSIVFVEYKTRNAERIELFCNARESEAYVKDGTDIFVSSEYIRQVTFGTGSSVGVARQVIGNYAHFWTWKKQDEDHLTGNVLTAAYLDPQDALFFK